MSAKKGGGAPLPRPAPKPYIDYHDLPPFVFYPQFAEDWEPFSGTVRKAVGKFLNLLQERYADPEFQREWEQHGKYWVAWLPEIEYRVIWQVVYPTHLGVPMTSQPAEAIHVVAVEPIPGRPKRGA